KGTTPNPDVAYVGAGTDLFFRLSAASGFVKLDKFKAEAGNLITAIVMDPLDWQTVYVLTDKNRFQGTAIGTKSESWHDLRGNIADYSIDTQLGTKASLAFNNIQVVHTGGHTVLLVACAQGVLRLIDPGSGSTWSRFGSGLPNTPVASLRYNATDDV